eukprot:Clim_evm5s250 gene=Clim_evmTU5s250
MRTIHWRVPKWVPYRYRAFFVPAIVTSILLVFWAGRSSSGGRGLDTQDYDGYSHQTQCGWLTRILTLGIGCFLSGNGDSTVWRGPTEGERARWSGQNLSERPGEVWDKVSLGKPVHKGHSIALVVCGLEHAPSGNSDYNLFAQVGSLIEQGVMPRNGSKGIGNMTPVDVVVIHCMDEKSFVRDNLNGLSSREKIENGPSSSGWEYRTLKAKLDSLGVVLVSLPDLLGRDKTWATVLNFVRDAMENHSDYVRNVSYDGKQVFDRMHHILAMTPVDVAETISNSGSLGAIAPLLLDEYDQVLYMNSGTIARGDIREAHLFFQQGTHVSEFAMPPHGLDDEHYGSSMYVAKPSVETFAQFWLLCLMRRGGSNILDNRSPLRWETASRAESQRFGFTDFERMAILLFGGRKGGIQANNQRAANGHNLEEDHRMNYSMRQNLDIPNPEVLILPMTYNIRDNNMYLAIPSKDQRLLNFARSPAHPWDFFIRGTLRGVDGRSVMPWLNHEQDTAAHTISTEHRLEPAGEETILWMHHWRNAYNVARRENFSRGSTQYLEPRPWRNDYRTTTLCESGDGRPYTTNESEDDYQTIHPLDRLNQLDQNQLEPTSSHRTDAKTTVMINGFNRWSIMRRLSLHYGSSPYVDRIIIVWHDTDTEPPANFYNGLDHLDVFVTLHDFDTLNNRYNPRPEIRTTSVVIIDDDILVPLDDFARAFKAWQANRDSLVGIFPRGHVRNEDGTYEYLFEGADYSIILTKFAFAKTEYLYYYTCLLPDAVHELVDEGMNCEDLAFQMMISGATGSSPVAVSGSAIDFGSAKGISSKFGHYNVRPACLQTLSKIFGGMPLQRNALMYADFKDIPFEHIAEDEYDWSKIDP